MGRSLVLLESDIYRSQLNSSLQWLAAGCTQRHIQVGLSFAGFLEELGTKPDTACAGFSGDTLTSELPSRNTLGWILRTPIGATADS